MQEIKFEPGSSASSFDDEYVMDVASELGVRFPLEYLALLKRANGGKPIQQYFALGNNEKVIERFLSFVANYKESPFGIYDIEVVWSQIEDRLEEGICPFAMVFAGDFLCFDCRQENKEPSIVLWDHDKAAQGKLSLIPVATDFDQFTMMLRG